MMKEKNSSRYFLLLSCCLVISLISCWQNQKRSASENLDSNESFSADSIVICVIMDIVDGDTYKVIIDDQEYKVRLIGIDTPESTYNFKTKADAEKTGMSINEITSLGREATRFVEGYISKGDSIKLEFDVQQFDKYGRLLAFLHLMDGRMLNDILVREGYAQVMTVPPNVKFQDQFLAAQREARENKRGLWSDSLN